MSELTAERDAIRWANTGRRWTIQLAIWMAINFSLVAMAISGYGTRNEPVRPVAPTATDASVLATETAKIIDELAPPLDASSTAPTLAIVDRSTSAEVGVVGADGYPVETFTHIRAETTPTETKPAISALVEVGGGYPNQPAAPAAIANAIQASQDSRTTGEPLDDEAHPTPNTTAAELQIGRGSSTTVQEPARAAASDSADQRAEALTADALIIVNPHTTRGAVNYVVNGEVYTLLPGEYHRLAGSHERCVVFHQGDDFGVSERKLEGGVFAFRIGEEGWELTRPDSSTIRRLLIVCRPASLPEPADDSEAVD